MWRKLGFAVFASLMIVLLVGHPQTLKAEECDETLLFDPFKDGDLYYKEYGAREAVLVSLSTSFYNDTLIIPEKTVDEAGNERTVVGIDMDYKASVDDIYVPSTVRFVRNVPYDIRSIHFQDVPDLTIEEEAFSGCEDMVTVAFNPEGKLKVGEKAFTGCIKLGSITFPANADIHETALDRCFGLKTINNAPKYLDLGQCEEKNPDEVFILQTVSFSPGLKEIEGIEASISRTSTTDPFDLKTLTSITIPAGVQSITGFSDTGLTSVALPAGIKTIGRAAFAGCEKLRTINLPDSITMIDEGAFSGCTALTGITRLPSSIQEVGGGAFRDCINLKMAVDHPCNWLTDQYRGSGITSITLNLREAPDEFHRVFASGLAECPNLKSITVKGSSRSYKSIDGALYYRVFDYNTQETVGWSLAKYPAGKSSSVRYDIPKDALYVSGFAFEGCKFSEIHIPVTVQVIEQDVDCTDKDYETRMHYPFDDMAANTKVYYVYNSYADDCVALSDYSNKAGEYGPTVPITYQLNGGTNAASNPTSFTAGKSVTLADPTRKGYIFTGWQEEYNGKYFDVEKNVVVPIGEQLVNGLTLAARWEKDNRVKKGDKVKISGNTYKVKKAATEKTGGTVIFVKAKNKKSITVPSTVKLSDGNTYKVVEVAKKAFTASKIRKVTLGANVKTIKAGAFTTSKATKLVLKTKKLTKASVKGSLKKSKIKTIQVKVGKTSVNKKYIKKYKAYFTKKNAGAEVTVK